LQSGGGLAALHFDLCISKKRSRQGFWRVSFCDTVDLFIKR
jgi:hypothetical protein